VDGGGEFVAWGVGSWRAATVAAAPVTPATKPVTSARNIPSVHAPASSPAVTSPVVSAPAPAPASAVSVPAASAPARVTVNTSVEQVVTPQAAPVPVAPAARSAASMPARAEYNPGSPFKQQQTRAQQPRITIAWERADIRDVLAAFAAFSGRTIIPARAVGELTVTAEIIDKPWDVAMRAILNANGLDAVEDQNGIIIVNTIEALASTPRLEPMITRTVRLNYTSSSAVSEVIRSRLSRDCSGMQASAGAGASSPATPVSAMNCPVRGTVTSDTLTNSVSITDVPTTMEDLVAYAQSLDVRQPQVNIKAKIILVDRTQLEGLGLKYDLGTRTNHFNELLPRLDSLGSPESANIFTLGGNTVAAIANASQSVSNAALKIVYSTALGGYDFSTFLEALQTVSLLDVQAEPSVTTLNYRKAVLRAGTQVPIRTIEQGTGGNAGGQFPTVTVDFRQTGVVLEVTPYITNNRQILMKVHAENSDVQFIAGDVGAVFPTQSIDNDLLVGDGETAVMGGLTQTSVRVSKTGIPLLVDLPLIGRLFGVTNREETKRDLLILITPHIVDEADTAMEPRRQP
jgi:type IV pilus assembly protein PilQ